MSLLVRTFWVTLWSSSCYAHETQVPGYVCFWLYVHGFFSLDFVLRAGHVCIFHKETMHMT